MSDWRTASHKRSLASYGSTLVEKNVLLTFTITDPHRGNHPVAFKTDGERFPDNPRTIKLGCNQKYLIEIVSKPEQSLTSLEIDGVSVFLQENPNSPGSFSGVWIAPKDINTKSTRARLLVILTGENVSFTTVWQCKIYEANNSHSIWGDNLYAILYICHRNDTGNLVISEEHYKGAIATLRRSTSHD